MAAFALHPRLAADTVFVADWPLCRVLVMNDCRFAWLVLVPRKANLTELHDLSTDDLHRLVDEVARAGRALKAIAMAEKINTGALGNMVSQLHVHVVARKLGDAAWPGPVWGNGSAVSYTPDAQKDFVKALAAAF